VKYQQNNPSKCEWYRVENPKMCFTNRIIARKYITAEISRLNTSINIRSPLTIAGEESGVWLGIYDRIRFFY